MVGNVELPYMGEKKLFSIDLVREIEENVRVIRDCLKAVSSEILC